MKQISLRQSEEERKMIYEKPREVERRKKLHAMTNFIGEFEPA